jgi:hypothetical protein
LPSAGGGVLFNNTANGANALVANTTASNNTASGANALSSNTTGGNNTANGSGALESNTTGTGNTANGTNAPFHSTTGSFNTADGTNALFNNNAAGNTAAGWQTLLSNTTGKNNTAIGVQALPNNTIGSFNIAVGSNAGANLTTGSNNIDIGNAGVADDANTMRLGTVRLTATYMLGVNGATVPGGVGVIVDSTGHLGTVQSSARFKDQIHPMDRASEAILALQPVTFRYKRELDPDGIPQFGLVAEQVERVNPDLVVRDEDGKVMTGRYEAVNAMLLNEFLKEHQRVVEEHRKVEEQGASIAQLKKQIEALTATVQKVSDQIVVSKPAPRLVADHQASYFSTE